MEGRILGELWRRRGQRALLSSWVPAPLWEPMKKTEYTNSHCASKTSESGMPTCCEQSHCGTATCWLGLLSMRKRSKSKGDILRDLHCKDDAGRLRLSRSVKSLPNQKSAETTQCCYSVCDIKLLIKSFQFETKKKLKKQRTCLNTLFRLDRHCINIINVKVIPRVKHLILEINNTNQVHACHRTTKGFRSSFLSSIYCRF